MQLTSNPKCVGDSDYIGSYSKTLDNLVFEFHLYDNGEDADNIYYRVSLLIYGKDYSEISISFSGLDMKELGTLMLSEHFRIKGASK